ncbi:MAG TPA: hypothetical protein VGN12_13500 [Pirellulales bacterium]|jgi:hypothetical protein
MATVLDPPRLEPHVTVLLSRLRGRIRRYVALEGIAASIATLCGAFWLCLAADWFFEPSPGFRRSLLAIGAIATALVFYQMVVRRLAVPLSDARLALLLERRFRAFDDSLLTAVDMTQSDRELGDLTREMLASTLDEAALHSRQVSLDQVFRREPLNRALGAAGLLSIPLAIGLLVVPATLLFGVERLAGLTNDPWPRNTRLVVPGFKNGTKIVARGDDVDVVVQADLHMPRVPDVVQIRYVTGEAVRGRETMTRIGNADPDRDSYQDFRHTFSNVLSSLTFDVYGGDAHLRNLQIQVVDSPTVNETTLFCEYPAYMKRSPRELRVTGSMQVPLGTKIAVRGRANKDLVNARLDYSQDGTNVVSKTVSLPMTGGDLRTFAFPLPELTGDTTLSFTLLDTDGIQNRTPFVVALSAVADEPPQLSLQLRGIGTAVTPQARLPLVGQINDDYGVDAAGFHVTVDEQPPARAPFVAAPAGRNELTVDEAYEVRDLNLKPGQKILFGAEASDAYHLVDGDQPHTATGERFQLDVVAPETLRTMLESRELNLRQRFEATIAEVTETRDSLAGSDAEAKEKPAETDTPAQQESPAETAPSSDLSLERARQNAEKNGQETLGIATAFDDIREELVNNRVDTEELRVRLRDRIAEPLRVVGNEMFPECDRRLQALLAAPAGERPAARRTALEQVDAVLVAMEQIRDQMLELESFNEAIDMLRSIIDSEKSLQEQIRERQKSKVRDLLEDSE